MSLFRSTVVSASALVLVAGCGESGGASDPAGSDTGGLADLQGRSFQSVSLVDGADRPLRTGTPVIVSFTKDSVTGSAGCNSVGSTATVTDGLLVVEGPVGGTEIGCGKRQYHDRWMSDLLTSRPKLELDGDRLSLTSGDTVVELLDSASADPAQALVGRLWTLGTLEGGPGPDGTASSVPAGVTSTLRFGPQRVDAQLGCNGGSAGYDVEGDRMTLEPMLSSVMDCGEPAMPVESTVTEVLRGRVTWSIEGPELRLTSGARTLVYRAG